MIKSFSVFIPEEEITEMQRRIRATRWPPADAMKGWENGTDPSVLRSLLDYWASAYDWRATESRMNAFPNYIAEIEGNQIHFQHIPGKGNKTIPLLITHGWPGSFLEMHKLIPLLTAEGPFSFDLIIPSVPGFGFSRSTQPVNSAEVATLWNRLMHELGYKKYMVQGGDIGAGICTWLGLKFPESVIAMHLNFIPGSYQPFLSGSENPSGAVQSFLDIRNDWIAEEGAYSHLHATRPLTQAYGLNDSPAGLCAWIIEKFYHWSDHRGNFEDIFSKDELLGNVTLYWLTQTIYTSMEIYKENKRAPLHFGKYDFVHCPVAFAAFPKELPTPPREYVERGYNIMRWTSMPAGGHFAAMEQPGLLANDILDFYHSIVNNKT
jgi:pimeloyl-ACP methyl ester carboxylesterase